MHKILLALFLIPSIGFSQEKKDTKIIVTASDTANLFNRVALKLIDYGYSFEQKDKELNFISTSEKALKKFSASSKIRVIIKDSTVTFTGLVRIDVKLFGQADTFSPVHYWIAKGGIDRTIWDEMVLIAKSIGEKLTYSK